MPAPDSEIVCIITAASEIPKPEPPYWEGIQIPSQPSLARAECSSVGKILVWSVWSQ